MGSTYRRRTLPLHSSPAVVRGRPEVSVLMPVRDAGSALDTALRSIRDQSSVDWECVIVDDGSTDDSPRIACRFAELDGRFAVVRTEPRGIVHALSVGLAACRGRWIARMDGDDVMRRDRLDVQSSRLRSDRTLEAVGSHVRLFPRGALGPGWLEYERWIATIDSPADVVRERFVECPIVHPTLTARAVTIRKLGYRSRDWPEDYDLVLRLLASGRKLAVVPERLLAWRRDRKCLSERDPRYAPAAFASCKAHFLARGVLRGSRTFRLWGYGHTGRGLVRALDRVGCRPERIIDVHPGRAGAIVAGAPVVPPEQTGAPDGPVLLASVARARPREEIRAYLTARGFREGRDFLCVA